MFWKKFLAIMASIFLILVPACSFPGGPSSVDGTGQDPTAAVETRVAEIVASTAAAQTALANAVADTLAAMPTGTPEFTFTPSVSPTSSITPTSSFTPSPTFTFTSEVPTLTVSVQTNCRIGPGSAYAILGVLNVGQTAQVVGRSIYNTGTPANDSWIIKLPSNPSITCWLWGMYATVTGNWSSLPAATPPPTPTPVAYFTFSYAAWGVGPGYVCLNFNVVNTGVVTWSSYNFAVTDTTQGVNGVATSNIFEGYDNFCLPTGSLPELGPGGFGNVMVKLTLPLAPGGDSYEAALTLCSEDGLAGTCLTRTVSSVLP
jgi:hypothetical protein